MATNWLRPFANGTGANIVSEADWSGNSMKATLARGFQSGIAKSAEVNRALAQGTSAGYAIGQLVADYAGRDAGVDAADLYEGFQEALEKFFKAKMLDTIYPVGSVYMSTSSTNPRTLFGVGTWERIGAGRGLIDAGGAIAAGSTGGADTHALTVNEMPAHRHSGSTSSAGSHTHTRGSMNITGAAKAAVSSHGTGAGGYWGALYYGGTYTTNFRHMNEGAENWGANIVFDASRNWVGETSWNGAHTHAVTVGNTGGGQSFSIRNPYLAVYIWRRTA